MATIPDSHQEVYKDLIKRCKDYVKSRTSVVFDPTTGIQKTFVAGKLTEVKEVRIDKRRND